VLLGALSGAPGSRLKGEHDGNVELVRGERSARLVMGQAGAGRMRLSVAPPGDAWPARAALLTKAIWPVHDRLVRS